MKKNRAKPILKPLFSYSVKLPVGIDAPEALQKLRLLQEEETQLEASWNEQSGKIEILVMGDVQLEIIKRLMAERFNMPLEFEDGSIIYKETVKNTVEGVGHFEPLRHYAEVHLKIEPAVAGSGLIFESMCSEDELDKNWQRLILTHLAEKQHVGVLCGYPITDVKITLVSGKAHKKHTEGGDFRQATYRALRQGLMQAESVLLEPWMNFNIKLPSDATGRAMTELEQMGAKINPPDLKEDNTTLLSGRAPLRVLQNYQRAITAYTKGRGVLNCHFSGYDECTNSALVISERGYNPEADVENTPDSVFCEHGAGFAVKWDKVFDYMHIPLLKDKKRQEEQAVLKRGYVKNIATDDELLRIFEQTYGKTERKPYTAMQTVKKPAPQHYKAGGQLSGPEYLLIDGYNIIFADDDLKKIAAESLEDARVFLIDRVCNWQALKKINVILVFDAYKVKGTVREVERVHGVDVVYTREAETADAYIEKTSRELSKHSKVRVATSDALEQMIIFGNGAYRITAAEFMGEMRDTEEKMRKLLSKLNRPLTSKPFSDDMTMPETD